jgi:hypothetical protein
LRHGADVYPTAFPEGEIAIATSLRVGRGRCRRACFLSERGSLACRGQAGRAVRECRKTQQTPFWYHKQFFAEAGRFLGNPIALDVDEEPAVDVVNKLGAEYFVVSSDNPHSDGAFPQAIEQFLSLSLLDEQRRQILWDNCARLYAIKTPARPLSPEPRASAAE